MLHHAADIVRPLLGVVADNRSVERIHRSDCRNRRQSPARYASCARRTVVADHRLSVADWRRPKCSRPCRRCTENARQRSLRRARSKLEPAGRATEGLSKQGLLRGPVLRPSFALRFTKWTSLTARSRSAGLHAGAVAADRAAFRPSFVFLPNLTRRTVADAAAAMCAGGAASDIMVSSRQNGEVVVPPMETGVIHEHRTGCRNGCYVRLQTPAPDRCRWASVIGSYRMDNRRMGAFGSSSRFQTATRVFLGVHPSIECQPVLSRLSTTRLPSAASRRIPGGPAGSSSAAWQAIFSDVVVFFPVLYHRHLQYRLLAHLTMGAGRAAHSIAALPVGHPTHGISITGSGTLECFSRGPRLYEFLRFNLDLRSPSSASRLSVRIFLVQQQRFAVAPRGSGFTRLV